MHSKQLIVNVVGPINTHSEYNFSFYIYVYMYDCFLSLFICLFFRLWLYSSYSFLVHCCSLLFTARPLFFSMCQCIGALLMLCIELLHVMPTSIHTHIHMVSTTDTIVELYVYSHWEYSEEKPQTQQYQIICIVRVELNRGRNSITYTSSYYYILTTNIPTKCD